MCYIGRIITDSDITDKIDLIEVTNDFNCIDSGNNIPTLIVGWNKVKKLYNNISILEKKINENTYWTFSKREKRYEYEKDILIFYRNVFNDIIKNINYLYIDILSNNLSDIKKLINLFLDKKIKIGYIKNELLYLLYNNDVIGISLSELNYIGISNFKINNFLLKNNVFLIKDDDFLSKNWIPFINDNNIIIPYLYSLKFS